jgi:predicted ATPase/class 3 adenylate cyclase
VPEHPAVTTFLFTDIEGSTRLWEEQPERMRLALARHDALARAVVDAQHGIVVKMTGDGLHAVFDDPSDAVGAALRLQQALADPAATDGVALSVRCGLHLGAVERRDGDFFGAAVNRAARIMSAAHGGQVLLSQSVADLVLHRLPPEAALRDLGRVRLRDLANPERVYQLLHPRLRGEFPPLRSLEATPNNLPEQLTSFIGRERELADVERLLRQTRLLTLAGSGGLGKTRLSLQVAANVLEAWPDGVWFVELAPLSDARLVPQVLATVLGVKEDAGRPVIDAVMRHVADRALLVVLDNCEHLLSACADIARQLLQASPRLRILASSREPLRVSGETTYPVPALPVHDPREGVTPAALLQCEGVRLFVERAVAAQPSFQLTPANAAAVAEICYRLDGIPLALELAAARVRALSVDTIAARLGDRFRLLTAGDPTALPRQRTLRALIDWSYDLLTEAERALLRRLAVFAGGFTLDAVEAVGAAADLEPSRTVDTLIQLVEKSLVALEAAGERYRLLETVRQYAEERLEESGEGTEARDRHLAFYVELAERARPELTGPKQGAWLARLDLERENLLAAHAWADRAQGGAELGLRLVIAAKQYWINRGLLELGHRATLEALARPQAQRRTVGRSRGLLGAGQLCCFMGRYEAAEVYLQESLAIAREIGDRGRIAAVLQPLAMASLGQGDAAKARGHLEEALALARALGNDREIAAAQNALAQVYRVEGALDAAEPLYRDVLALARKLGDREIIGIALLNLAMVAVGRGSHDAARAALLEVVSIVEEIGSEPAAQSMAEVSAGLASARGEWDRAARFYGAAEAQAVRTGLHRDPTDEAFLAPWMEKARFGLGAGVYAAAEAAGRALSHDAAVQEVRAWLERAPAPSSA